MRLSIIKFVAFIAVIMACHAMQIDTLEEGGPDRLHSPLKTFCNFCDERFSPANWQWNSGNCIDDTHTDDPREVFSHTHPCEIYECIGDGCSEYYHGRFMLLMGLIVSAIDLSMICCRARGDYQPLPT